MADSVAQFFEAVESKAGSGKTAGLNGTFQFNISGENGGEWNIVFTDGSPKVSKGKAESPNITLSATDEDWLNIVNGKTSGTTAFLTGKLKIQGDMGLAMKLQSILG